MSSKFAILPADAIFDQRIKPQHLQTLAALSYHGGNRNRGCWPSYAKIADELHISRRSVMQYVKHLIDCGYVIKEQRLRENGSRSSNIYRVNIDIEIDDLGSEPARTTPSVAVEHHPSERTDTTPSEPARTPIKNHTNLEQDKKNKKSKSVLVTLQQWEENLGCQLNSSMIASWCREKGLYHPTITRLIEEFRLEMQSKDKLYADFAKTFQVWLTKGYLSLTLAGAQATSKREAMALDTTTINRRGGDL